MSDTEQAEPGSRAIRTAGTASHLVPLPGGTWSVWDWMCLRGTGFEASFVLDLASPETARIVDSLLEAETEEERLRRLAMEAIEALRESLVESSAESRAPVQKALKSLHKGQAPAPFGLPVVDAPIEALRTCLAQRDAARAALPASFAAAAARTSAALRKVAADPRFREALTWQNRSALATALDPLLRHTGAVVSKDRQKERLIASYLQRYCTKNDTIGFFGPVGWAKLTPTKEPLVIRPGADLIELRAIHLEQWVVDALAATIVQDPRVEPFMAPRVLPFVQLDGEVVRSALSGKHPLAPAQRALLAACDAKRSASEIAAALQPQFPDVFATEASVFDSLRDLRAQKLIVWTLEVPLRWNPEALLREKIERIGDDDARRKALDLLEEMERARDAVGAAAGDPAALDAALAATDATFTRLTGAAPSRNSGSMYAARGIVFEDCRRDLHAEVGPRFLEEIGPALSLMLTSARWLTVQVAAVYGEAFRKIHADLAKRAGVSAVPFSDAWFRFQRLLFGAKERPIDAVLASLQQRWAEVLDIPADARRVRYTSDELRAKVESAFDAPAPGWREACQHAPDLMITAPSIDAILAGDYEVALGEMHVATNTLRGAACVAQHPAAEELFRAMDRDLPFPRVDFLSSKEWPKVTLRTTATLWAERDYSLETSFDTAGLSPERTLLMSELVVDDSSGSLVVRARDGRMTMEAVEFLGHMLTTIVQSVYRLLPRGKHTPRVTIDRLVVSRESWTFSPSDLPFADMPSELDALVAVRRWARSHGLPRFIYAKATIEVKPIYVDLESPIFVAIFARLVKRSKDHVAGETDITIVEMLPGMEELWLPGAKGELYTCELRTIAVDPTRATAPKDPTQ